jgi:hypothetical protein
MEDKNKSNMTEVAIVVPQDLLPDAIDIINAGVNLGLFEVESAEFTFLGLESDEP